MKYKRYILYMLLGIIFSSCGNKDRGFVKIDYTKVEQKLVDRYKELTNTTSKADYYTSGILIHGLNIGEDGQSEVWIHRNMDRDKSVAFSFLRQDNKFRTSAYYDAGFIFYPYEDIPKGLDSLEALAAFPFDAGTDVRKCNDFGAGPYCESLKHSLVNSEIEFIQENGYVVPDISSFDFASLNITSPNKWFEYVNNVKGFDLVSKKGSYLHPAMLFLFQPPIRLDKGSDESNKQYFALIGPIREFISKLIKDNSAYKHLEPFVNGIFSNNEILIKSWDESKPESMPIEYFFFTINDYKINSFESMRKAVSYKQSFLKKTGRDIPIVAIQFPHDGKEAQFYRYEPEE